MQTLKRILVPVDFSDYSVAAIRRGSDLAKLFGAELLLCHVLPHSLYPEGMGFGAPSEDDMANELLRRLSDLAQREVDPEVPCVQRVWRGSPAAVINAKAAAEQVDMVVMPTHGRSGLSEVLIGSTAERVVRGAPCEVLVLRCGADEAS